MRFIGGDIITVDNYELSNGWSVFKTSSSKFILHVKPIENNVIRSEYCVEIPRELFDSVASGIRDVKVLGKEHDLYSHALIFMKATLPTKKQTSEFRRKKHANHLDYFYGDYWSIFEDKNHKFFLEFDVGHFASKFVGYHADIRGLLTYWLTAPTLLIPP